MYANKLVTTRHAIENNNTFRSQVMEPGASNNPPDPHQNLLFVALWWRGFKALLNRCAPFSLIDVGRASFAYVVFFSLLSALLPSFTLLVVSPSLASPYLDTDPSGRRGGSLHKYLLKCRQKLQLLKPPASLPVPHGLSHT
eukprot:459925-Pelagomonas_calceolata.AAC.1